MQNPKRFHFLSGIIVLIGVKLVFAPSPPEKNAANDWIEQNEAKAKEVNFVSLIPPGQKAPAKIK